MKFSFKKMKEVAEVAAAVTDARAMQDLAEGVLGAAEDGSVKVFVASAIFQRRNPRPIPLGDT